MAVSFGTSVLVRTVTEGLASIYPTDINNWDFINFRFAVPESTQTSGAASQSRRGWQDLGWRRVRGFTQALCPVMDESLLGVMWSTSHQLNRSLLTLPLRTFWHSQYEGRDATYYAVCRHTILLLLSLPLRPEAART